MGAGWDHAGPTLGLGIRIEWKGVLSGVGGWTLGVG